jgi:hypothetical protein
VAVSSIYHPTHSIFIWQTETEGRGPCLREHSCINGESFGDLPELVFPQMRLACDIPRQVALRYIAQSLAQFFVGNAATQQFNLYQQVIAVVPANSKLLSLILDCHAIPMLKALLA